MASAGGRASGRVVALGPPSGLQGVVGGRGHRCRSSLALPGRLGRLCGMPTTNQCRVRKTRAHMATPMGAWLHCPPPDPHWAHAGAAAVVRAPPLFDGLFLLRLFVISIICIQHVCVIPQIGRPLHKAAVPVSGWSLPPGGVVSGSKQMGHEDVGKRWLLVASRCSSRRRSSRDWTVCCSRLCAKDLLCGGDITGGRMHEQWR